MEAALLGDEGCYAALVHHCLDLGIAAESNFEYKVSGTVVQAPWLECILRLDLCPSVAYRSATALKEAGADLSETVRELAKKRKDGQDTGTDVDWDAFLETHEGQDEGNDQGQGKAQSKHKGQGKGKDNDRGKDKGKGQRKHKATSSEWFYWHQGAVAYKNKCQR